MPDIYLAGPMTGLPKHNTDSFDAAREALRRDGWIVRCPAEHNRSMGFDPNTSDSPAGGDAWTADAMHWDLSQILDPSCEGIVLLPGWRNSRGANIEHDLTRYLGKSVWYWDPQSETAQSEPKTFMIGLSGYGGVGKDEVGQILVAEGYERVAKGDLIKDAMRRIDPWILSPDPFGGLFSRDEHHRVSSFYVREGNWLKRMDELKTGYPDARLFMQRLADGVTEALGADVWTEALWRDVDRRGLPFVVNTRISRPEEARAIVSRGGQVWRVERPGYGPANDNSNEVMLDDWPFDQVIVNDGSLEDLAGKVKACLSGCP